MVLAFEDDENGPEDIRKAEKRKTFQRNLEEQGLELELEPSHVRMIFEELTQCGNYANFTHVFWEKFVKATILLKHSLVWNWKRTIKSDHTRKFFVKSTL